MEPIPAIKLKAKIRNDSIGLDLLPWETEDVNSEFGSMCFK